MNNTIKLPNAIILAGVGIVSALVVIVMGKTVCHCVTELTK